MTSNWSLLDAHNLALWSYRWKDWHKQLPLTKMAE